MLDLFVGVIFPSFDITFESIPFDSEGVKSESFCLLDAGEYELDTLVSSGELLPPSNLEAKALIFLLLGLGFKFLDKLGVPLEANSVGMMPLLTGDNSSILIELDESI
jgi:hypothetical protein